MNAIYFLLARPIYSKFIMIPIMQEENIHISAFFEHHGASSLPNSRRNCPKPSKKLISLLNTFSSLLNSLFHQEKWIRILRKELNPSIHLQNELN